MGGLGGRGTTEGGLDEARHWRLLVKLFTFERAAFAFDELSGRLMRRSLLNISRNVIVFWLEATLIRQAIINTICCRRVSESCLSLPFPIVLTFFAIMSVVVPLKTCGHHEHVSFQRLKYFLYESLLLVALEAPEDFLLYEVV